MSTAMSLSRQWGCGQGHRDWLSWAVTSLGHDGASGRAEGTATLVISSVLRQGRPQPGSQRGLLRP